MDEVNDFPSVSSDDSEVPQHTGSEDDDQGIRLGADEDHRAECGEQVGPPVVVGGPAHHQRGGHDQANRQRRKAFSTAIRHFDFCAFCQNSVTTYINDATPALWNCSCVSSFARSPPDRAALSCTLTSTPAFFRSMTAATKLGSVNVNCLTKAKFERIDEFADR